MSHEVCEWVFCFVPLHAKHGDKVFAFSDYLVAVALLAVVYTTTDYRYKFRIATAPGDLYRTTFGLLAAVGIGSLMSMVWPAEGWWVPHTVGLTQVRLQAIWAILFLSALFTWMWYAFISPPVFGWRNKRRFRGPLMGSLVRGNEIELSAIAIEISRSAPALVRYAKQIPQMSAELKAGKKDMVSVADLAHETLFLMGNRKFCKAVVRSSPQTAMSVFKEIAETQKYMVPIAPFSKNISAEAIRWEDSFLYDDAEDFASGLLGQVKPVSRAIYGNYPLVAALADQFGSPLDLDYRDRYAWTAKQWKVYFYAALLTFEDALKRGQGEALMRVFGRVIEDAKSSYHDLAKLDGMTDAFDTDTYQRLKEVVDFIDEAVRLLDKYEVVPAWINHRGALPRGIYDELADLVVDMCFAAGRVNGSFSTSWMVQYNTVWSDIFDMEQGNAWRILRRKVIRLLYEEIAGMSKNPNYKSARILGFCLNVVGFANKPRPKRDSQWRDNWALAKVASAWAKRGYLQLRKELPDVAETVLVGSISFDEKHQRLVKTYTKGLRPEVPRDYLDLDPPAAA